MKKHPIGMIAEDESDIDVLKILAKGLTNRNLSVEKFVGKGCGKFPKKTSGWCKVLCQKGCKSIVLVRDRDRNDENVLRRDLEKLISDLGLQEIVAVVIPCEELEAWLLSDLSALRVAMNLSTVPKQIAHPETIKSPKEHIAKLVRQHSKNDKKYVNSVHNSVIAKSLDVSRISQRCPSFRRFEQFIAKACL